MKICYYIWLPALLTGLLGCNTGEKEPPVPGTGAAIGQVNSALAARPEAPVRMAFDRFSTDDGLSSNTITRIFQDSRGFIWLGSSEGLDRYDGYIFQPYRHEANNPKSLLENAVLHISEDSKGHIWVLCATGLSEIDPETEHVQTYTDSIVHGRINSFKHGMVVDRHDVVWINGLRLAFDIGQKKFVEPTIPTDLSLQYATNSQKDVFGFATTPLNDNIRDARFRSIIVKQKPDAPLQFDILSDTVTSRPYFIGNAVCLDQDRYVRTVRQQGQLEEYDLQTSRFSQTNPRVGSIIGLNLVANSRVLWLAGWGGLGRCDLNLPPEFGARVYSNNDREPHGLPVHTVISVLEDRQGNVWAGTLYGGLCRYSPSVNKFERYQYTFPDTTGLPGRAVDALCFDQYDRLWIGTDKGLCRLTNRKDATFVTFRQPQPPRQASNFDAIKSICEDPATERLYMAYWGVPLDYFDTKKEQYFPLPISSEGASTGGGNWMQSYNAFVATAKRSSNGHIFYSSFGYFLHRYEPENKKLTTFCSGDAANDKRLREQGYFQLTQSVWPETPNRIWIGTVEKPVALKLDLAKGNDFGKVTGTTELDAVCSPPRIGNLTCFKTDENDPNKLQNGSANCFLEDSKKRLWIGTAAGLHFVKDREQGVFECFGTEAGFPNANIQAMLEDDRGKLWVSTFDGICCFDPETKHVTAHFDADDGLQGNQFNMNSAAKNSWGLMAFGGPNGFNLFHPDSIFHIAHTPTVELINFEANGIAHTTPKEGAELPHTDKNLAFAFSVMDFSNPKRNQYQYFLEGYDTGWCAPTPVRQVRYTNLAPGGYTFHARGCNADGIWSQTDLVFPVTILAPWWATWWFRGLLALIALGIVVLLIRRREARMRRKLEEDERTIRYLQVQTLQAQMNPHFIFNVLGVMQHQIITSKPQEANRQLGNLSTLIRRFLDSSVSSAPMVKGLSQNDIPLEEEIELLTMYAEFEVLQRQEKFEGKGFSVEVDDSVNVSTVRIPPMIIQPYIENAVKHGIRYLPEGRKGFVRIRFSREGDALCCTVEDNGVGRDEAARIQAQSHSIYKSHGTRLVKERTEILNHIGYDIAIETRDRPSGGTIVTIKIKD